MTLFTIAGIYLTISMAVTSVSVILTVFVLKLHHCGPHQTEVPPWIRKWILTHLARAIKCQCSGKRTNSKSKMKKQKNNFPNSDHQQYYYAPARQKSHTDIHESTEACLRLVDDNYSRRASPVAEFRNNDRMLRQQKPKSSPSAQVTSLNHTAVSSPRLNHHGHANHTSSTPTQGASPRGHNAVPPSSFSSGNLKASSDYNSMGSEGNPRFRDLDLISAPEIRRLGVMEEILKVEPVFLKSN